MHRRFTIAATLMVLAELAAVPRPTEAAPPLPAKILAAPAPRRIRARYRPSPERLAVARAPAGVLFDFDGVIANSVELHAKTFKSILDPFVARLSPKAARFDLQRDMVKHIAGRTRIDGILSFLRSRGIRLDANDPQVLTLAKQKNQRFRELLTSEGVSLFGSTIATIRRLRSRGVRVGCVSSSTNTRDILARTGLLTLFDAVHDGRDNQRDGIKGKPDPAPFLAGARKIHVAPARTIVVEDGTAGVISARKGGFGLVVGVARARDASQLAKAGADLVVHDLADAQRLLFPGPSSR